MKTFKTYLDEVMHRELLHVAIRAKDNKAAKFQKKWQDVKGSLKNPGTPGYMHAGSSRYYVQHSKPEHVRIDGKKARLETGLKVINTDGYDHEHFQKHSSEFGNLTLGGIQNKAESHPANDKYRVLVRGPDHTGVFGHKVASFKHNPEGILPPLVKASKKHHWLHVGHVRDFKDDDIFYFSGPTEFRHLTKTKSHPEGITHTDFHQALVHHHAQRTGEVHLTPVDQNALTHPLVKKFDDYVKETGQRPGDFASYNMGVWKHPVTGKEHIVLRDHGFSQEAEQAYKTARQR